ncbi:MAG: IPT/TIG domain-containing protein, partial [Phocaeicola sp.]
GICVDDEGNLIICDSNNADVLRMISAVDGYVSTLAGTLGVETPQVNGAPGEAIFLDLQDVTYDGEGGYYICEWWESTIRKYSVE